MHAWTILADPGGTGKAWVFIPDPVFWSIGLLAFADERPSPSPWVTATRQKTLTWVQDAAGNPYIGSVLTTLDPGTAYEKQTKTEQTVDTHGNVTQTKIYDYGNLTTPARTYTHTYLTNANYTSRHIWNRLVSTTVTGSGQTATLVGNAYDAGSVTDRAGLRNHDAAFGTGFSYRGNATSRWTPGSVLNFSYDITGSVTSASDGAGHTVTVTPASGTNYAAPGTITTSGLTTTMSSYDAPKQLTQVAMSRCRHTQVDFRFWPA